MCLDWYYIMGGFSFKCIFISNKRSHSCLWVWSANDIFCAFEINVGFLENLVENSCCFHNYSVTGLKLRGHKSDFWCKVLEMTCDFQARSQDFVFHIWTFWGYCCCFYVLSLLKCCAKYMCCLSYFSVRLLFELLIVLSAE